MTAPTEPTDSSADQQAARWFALADAGKTQEIWQEAGATFRAAITPERWAEQFHAARGPLRALTHVALGATITLCAIAAGCTQPLGSSARTIRPVTLPLAASSMSTIYGIQLDLRGSAVVRDRWVYVDIPSGAARTYQGRAVAWDLVVRAGIATCSGPGVGHLIAEGAAGHVAPIIGLTRDNPELDTIPRTFIAPLRVDVGIPPGTDLARSWVTLDFSWPIDATIASYSLTATHGLLRTAADSTAIAPAPRPANDTDMLLQMEALHAPPPSIHCT